jgi:hypothetical protein
LALAFLPPLLASILVSVCSSPMKRGAPRVSSAASVRMTVVVSSTSPAAKAAREPRELT